MATSTSTPTRRVAQCDWRCTRCFALLGKRQDGRVHLRTTRGVEYAATLPVTAACRCGALNRLAAPRT